MRTRVVAPGMALVVSLVASAAAGQCTYLGAPSLSGCAPGGGLAPGLYCYGSLQIGTNVALVYSDPSSPLGFFYPVLLLGDCSSPPVPAPLATPLCPPSVVGGCFRYVNPLAVVAVPPIPGTIPWFFSIPNDPAFVGLLLCAQVIGDLSGLCIGVTNGLQFTILP